MPTYVYTIRYGHMSNSLSTSRLFNIWASCVLAKSGLIATITGSLGRAAVDTSVLFPPAAPQLCLLPGRCNRCWAFPRLGASQEQLSTRRYFGAPRGALESRACSDIARSKVGPAAGLACRPSWFWSELPGGQSGEGRDFGSSGGYSTCLAGEIC